MTHTCFNKLCTVLDGTEVQWTRRDVDHKCFNCVSFKSTCVKPQTQSRCWSIDNTCNIRFPFWRIKASNQQLIESVINSSSNWSKWSGKSCLNHDQLNYVLSRESCLNNCFSFFFFSMVFLSMITVLRCGYSFEGMRKVSWFAMVSCFEVCLCFITCRRRFLLIFTGSPCFSCGFWRTRYRRHIFSLHLRVRCYRCCLLILMTCLESS